MQNNQSENADTELVEFGQIVTARIENELKIEEKFEGSGKTIEKKDEEK